MGDRELLEMLERIRHTLNISYEFDFRIHTTWREVRHILKEHGVETEVIQHEEE